MASAAPPPRHRRHDDYRRRRAAEGHGNGKYFMLAEAFTVFWR